MIALFGESSETVASDDAQRSKIDESASAGFALASIHAMFQALDTNDDGVICAHDLDHWLEQEKAATRTKSDGANDLNAFSHALHLDEIAAFLHAGATLSTSFEASSHINSDSEHHHGNYKDGTFPPESPTFVNGIKHDMLSEDGLASCLALFPTLAFDWEAPLSTGSRSLFANSNSRSAVLGHLQGQCFNRENAAVLFRRLDTDSNGLITAADMRIWRRMLPLGRSEDDLIRSIFGKGAHATAACKSALSLSSMPHEVFAKNRTSKLAKICDANKLHQENNVPDHIEEMPGLKQWDFYMKLRENPMLIAELCTQVALLDFIVDGGHQDGNQTGPDKAARAFSSHMDDDKDDFFGLLDFEDVSDIRGSVARSEQIGLRNDASLRTVNDVPSDTLVSAFTCVAKLKLCRLAAVHREATAQEDSMATSVLHALDSRKSGYVDSLDIQTYLQKHASLYSATMDDLSCCLLDDDDTFVKVDIDNDTVKTAQLDFAEGGRELGNSFDKNALRAMLSRPIHLKLASLLYRFVQVQQEYASHRYQEIAEKTHQNTNSLNETYAAADSSDLPRNTQSKMRDRLAARRSMMFASDFSSQDQVSSQDGRLALLADPKKQPSVIAPMFAVEAKQKLPRAFGQVALQKWFKELDANRDGLVSALDLKTWCTAANCRGLVEDADLESLFQSSLPNFSGRPLHSSSDDLKTNTEEEVAQLLFQSSMEIIKVEKHVSGDSQPFTAAMHIDNIVESDKLNEVGLAVALVRRPLLAARLALIRRVSHAVQAMIVAEACSTTALTAAAKAATAADRAAAPSSNQERTQALADTSKFAARCAAAQAKSAIDEVLTICGQRAIGSTKDSKSSWKDNPAKRLEAFIKKTEVENPRSSSVCAARRALQEHFLSKARRRLTLLSVEVALEVKLLAWREAEHYPTQLQELRALPPLHSMSRTPPSLQAAASTKKEKPACLLQEAAAKRGASDPGEESGNGPPLMAKIEAKSLVKKHSAPMRRTSFRDKLSGMMQGSSGHFKNMTQSLRDGDVQEEPAVIEKVGSVCGTSLDLVPSQSTVTASRIDSRNRAKARARLKSPRPLPPREETPTFRENTTKEEFDLNEPFVSENSLTMDVESQTVMQARNVPARRTSFRDKLSGMMQGSSGHFKNMTASLGDDEYEERGKGATKYKAASTSSEDNNQSSISAEWESHHNSTSKTSLDQEEMRTMATESRIAARNRAKMRACTMSPRRPPPRKEASSLRESPARAALVDLSDQPMSECSVTTDIELKVVTMIPSAVPARRASFRDKLKSMMQASNGHIEKMVEAVPDAAKEDNDRFKSSDRKDHQYGSYGTSLDQQDVRATGIESRIAARNRAKVKACTMSPRRPPPRRIRGVAPQTNNGTPVGDESRELPHIGTVYSNRDGSCSNKSIAPMTFSNSSSSSSSSGSDESDDGSDSEVERPVAHITTKQIKSNHSRTRLGALPSRSLAMNLFGEVNKTASNPVQDLESNLFDAKTRLRNRAALSSEDDDVHVDMEDD